MSAPPPPPPPPPAPDASLPRIAPPKICVFDGHSYSFFSDGRRVVLDGTFKRRPVYRVRMVNSAMRQVRCVNLLLAEIDASEPLSKGELDHITADGIILFVFENAGWAQPVDGVDLEGYEQLEDATYDVPKLGGDELVQDASDE